MFPCAHIHYSNLAALSPESGSTPDAGTASSRVIGAILPDAAFTAAFSWQELHDPDHISSLVRHLGETSKFADVLTGIRHHIELDERSHHRWRDQGGYAYTLQTPELRETVGAACGVAGEIAHTLAHNFIEAAVDIHLLAQDRQPLEMLRDVCTTFDVSRLATALSSWNGSDDKTMRQRLELFLDIWPRHDLAATDGMVSLWEDLIDHLTASTFPQLRAESFDKSSAYAALEIAVRLTKPEFYDVVRPEVG